jgi:small-conductance mechanosensitive channel
MDIENYKIQLIESGIVIGCFLTLKFVLAYLVKHFVSHSYFKLSEKKDVIKLINLILFVLFTIVLVSIWSVKQENILVFASSIITVFGVAMFAEMSILSNVTACIILFFQHPIKIGDRISVSFEGKEIEGELIDISYFFVFIKTRNRGTLTIPNALLLKSSFEILEKEEKP